MRKVVAWLHIMHMELRQKNPVLSFSKCNPFGKPGIDYSDEYVVTSIPLTGDADWIKESSKSAWRAVNKAMKAAHLKWKKEHS